ncbi:hypothetical protein M514_26367 [Trichuris suis]|uniref:Uncharacterized protein n=1 Tax=Trichuris suis TaxID=68888 RepID=A0A085MW75_9BILA|nr:hypothetical protein M514_26367 [Trichuris suis]
MTRSWGSTHLADSALIISGPAPDVLVGMMHVNGRDRAQASTFTALEGYYSNPMRALEMGGDINGTGKLLLASGAVVGTRVQKGDTTALYTGLESPFRLSPDLEGPGKCLRPCRLVQAPSAKIL